MNKPIKLILFTRKSEAMNIFSQTEYEFVYYVMTLAKQLAKDHYRKFSLICNQDYYRAGIKRLDESQKEEKP
jgi:hypothetical protein